MLNEHNRRVLEGRDVNPPEPPEPPHICKNCGKPQSEHLGIESLGEMICDTYTTYEESEGFIRTAQDAKAHCIGCGKGIPPAKKAWFYWWCENCRTIPSIEAIGVRSFPPCICPIPCVFCGWQASPIEDMCGCQDHR